MRATTTECPNCAKARKYSLIKLTPPYLCEACGYSMIYKRYINYPKNIVLKKYGSSVRSPTLPVNRTGKAKLSYPIPTRLLIGVYPSILEGESLHGESPVTISGRLVHALQNSGIPSEDIVLSCEAATGQTRSIAFVITKSDGSYFIEWWPVPSLTPGIYAIRSKYLGSAKYARRPT